MCPIGEVGAMRNLIFTYYAGISYMFDALIFSTYYAQNYTGIIGSGLMKILPECLLITTVTN